VNKHVLKQVIVEVLQSKLGVERHDRFDEIADEIIEWIEDNLWQSG